MNSIGERLQAALHDDPDARVRAEQNRTLLVRSRVLCWVALGVIPFTILAYNAVFLPERIVDGAAIAAVANMAVVLLLVGLTRGVFNRWPAGPMMILLAIVANGAELAQLTITGGPTESTFFFPYYLVFFGIATFYPARLKSVVITCLSLPFGYWALGLALGDDVASQQFLSNTILLVNYAAISMIANRMVTTIFLREVRVRLDLEVANAQLRELDRLKSEFFANVSHELKTPLTLILAPVSSLLEEEPGPLADQQRTLLQDVRRNAGRLYALINDLLLLARLEASKLAEQVKKCELLPVVRQAVESVNAYAKSLDLSLKVEVDDEVTWYGDERHFERILLNLLSNACKFSEPGGVITVRLWNQPDAVVLEVADEGIGIDPSHWSTLFDRFVQVEGGATRRFEGTGIGLAIVKELAEHHGGSVGLDSAVGRGSTFTVRLPHREETDAPASTEWTDHSSGSIELDPELRADGPVRRVDPTPRATALDAHRPRVVVVEDNPELLSYLTQELGRAYAVRPFKDSRAALDDIVADPPDLVLSDVMMPVLGGIELARTLKNDPRTQDIPILLLSARDDLETKVEGFAAGVDDYVPKPFELSELRARIDVHLRLRAQAVRLEQNARELRTALENLKLAEASLLQREKMALLGSVIAGVAHETNNPLHFLTGNLDLLESLLEEHMPEDELTKTRELVADMRESAERMRTVIRQLLAFGRKAGEGATSVRLRELVELGLKMVRPSAPPGVTITNTLGADATVLANPQDLFQITLNLVHNAVQAVDPAKGRIELAGETKGDVVELTIRDDGVGIAAENLARIFEPFYTTKPPGQGTGLGLSIVRELVVAQGGRVHVESAVDAGTTFTLLLPAGPPP